MDWIRWTTAKTGTSLWHQAYRRHVPVRVRRRGRIGSEPDLFVVRTKEGDVPFRRSGTPRIGERDEIEVRDLVDLNSEAWPEASELHLRVTYRRTACGFTIPSYHSMEHWSGEGLPPGPRCIYCLNGWVVDVSPPGGTPPAGSGTSGVIRISGGKKRPPTLHA